MRYLKLSVFVILGVISYALCYAFFWAASWFILYSLFRGFPRSYAHLIGASAVLIATLSALSLLRSARKFYGPEDSPLIGTGRHDTAASVLFEHYGNRVTGTAYLLGQLFLAGPFCLIKAGSYLKPKPPSVN